VRLRIVAFGAGAVLMSLELAGSRVLAPYFGSSVYVWGSLIGAFLGALSAGYHLGGAVADRWPRRGVLAALLLAAGFLILLLPIISPFVLAKLTDWDLGPRGGPLLASLLLFAPPSVLLGTASPFIVKLATNDLAAVGRVTGALYAISTVGSIAGTLLTAFFLIPGLGIRAIIHLLGVSLPLLAGLLVTEVRVQRVVFAAPVVVALLVAPALQAPGRFDVLWETESTYHRIRVVTQDSNRYLVFNRSFQGGMHVGDVFESPYRYTDYMHLAWIFNPAIRRLLVIGLGAGSIPKRFWRDYADVTVDVVELDPAVVEAAKRFFAVEEDARLRITVQDGRLFLRRSEAKYDLIVMDAYLAEGIPFHLATREFFELARAHLTPRGLIAANIVGMLEGPNSNLFRALYRTYGEVFPGLYVFPVAYLPRRNAEEVRTIVLMATSQVGLTPKQLATAAQKLRQSGRIRFPQYDAFVADYYAPGVPTADVPLLTDDYGPVDILPVFGWEPERR